MSMRDLTDHLDAETLRRIVDVQAARLQLLQRELAKAEHDRDRYRARLDAFRFDKLLELKRVATEFCEMHGCGGVQTFGTTTRNLLNRMVQITREMQQP